MAVKYSLNSIAQLQGRDVFLDANVLIYLFWPTGSVNWQNKYASAFAQLLRQRNKLCVDFLVISEVINRVIRYEHVKLQPALKFKEFRDSQEGKDAIKDIYKVVENDILNRFHFIDKAFSKDEVHSFLNIDTLDFVDKAILKVCKDNNCILLTNDKDFKAADIDILTANPALLYN
ncbi:MAG: twitching motility protein PilT [Bacteroidales bacterium 36-12]|nr:MAG: twitching motility protein PilT [Bacteroidales bacterium 36-12]